MKRTWGLLITMGALILLFQSCSIKLKSESIPPEMKTINVSFFENDAPLVVGNLSQLFTEALKERIRSTTNLSIVTREGDASLSGSITDYRYGPISIQATQANKAPIAGASALTITVKVKFNYDANKKISFDRSFTKSLNYTGDLSSQEQTLIQAINKQLIDDIFNAAFNNW
ncbi:MAG: LptE family protein [Mucilaginibacter sp.]